MRLNFEWIHAFGQTSVRIVAVDHSAGTSACGCQGLGHERVTEGYFNNAWFEEDCGIGGYPMAESVRIGG